MEYVFTSLLTACTLALAVLAYRKWRDVKTLREAAEAALGAKSAFDSACLEMRRRALLDEPGVVPVPFSSVRGVVYAEHVLRRYMDDPLAPETYDQMKAERDRAYAQAMQAFRSEDWARQKLVNDLKKELRPDLARIDALMDAACKHLVDDRTASVPLEFETLKHDVMFVIVSAAERAVAPAWPTEKKASQSSAG